MTDKKKVMQALQNCPDCSQCYTGGPGFGVACRDQLRRDALILLKEYEEERLEWISAVAKLTAEKVKLLKGQEAVEPKTMSSDYDTDTWWFVCGSCKKGVISPGDNFCRWCGRAVKWAES